MTRSQDMSLHRYMRYLREQLGWAAAPSWRAEERPTMTDTTTIVIDASRRARAVRAARVAREVDAARAYLVAAHATIDAIDAAAAWAVLAAIAALDNSTTKETT